MIQRGVGQLSTTNHSWVMKVFVKSIAPFFGQNKYTNIRRFSTIFRHKIKIFCVQKVQQNTVWVKWLHNIYLTIKLKVKHFQCLLKTLKYKYRPKFRNVQNKRIIYRPGMYNLQIRTSTFPGQEKLPERTNLRYLKTLKTRKLNTKNPQIKHCPCSIYVMVYRPDLQTWCTIYRPEKQLKK